MDGVHPTACRNAAAALAVPARCAMHGDEQTVAPRASNDVKRV